MDAAPPNILASKLHAPQLAPSQLERLLVAQRMNVGANVRLVVVHAPAGFGKTTVMLQHARRLQAAGLAHGWLNLDDADNDLARFLAHWEAAVARAAPDAACPGAEGGGALGLIERIAASSRPFTLFLDDFECLRSSSVLDFIGQVLEHMPRGWQLVIGARVVPSLALGRLRALGQVREIGMELLRFSEAEVAEFMSRHRGLLLSENVLQRLHSVTEGWATALWLASVSLEGRPRPEEYLRRFSGREASISEFLAEDVLDRQPEAVQDFLLGTSILNGLDAAICDAVLEREDSGAVLRDLERSHLFLVALEQPGHYRYHSLFAEFLRTQLAGRGTAAVVRLHRRAADWYQAQRRPMPAIRHMMLAGDLDAAARLLESHAQELLDVGRFRVLMGFLDRLPDALLDAYPRLRLAQLWSMTMTRRYRAALALLERWRPSRSDRGAPWQDEARANLLALRPLLLRMVDGGWALAEAEASHALLNPRYRFPYSVLTNSLAYFYASIHRHDDARALLDKARRSHFEIGSTFSLVIAECVEGAISLREGRLQDALARFRRAMNHMATEESGRADGHALAAVQYAEALYEAGEPERAEQILRIYLAAAREFGLGDDFVVHGHITLSRLAWHRGEYERAFGVLGELEYQGHRDDLARMVASSELERSRVALLRGDIDAASAYLRQARARIGDRARSATAVPLHDVESIEVAELRLKVRAADADGLAEVRSELAVAIASAREQQCHRLRLHLELLRIEALRRAGRTAEAAEALGVAIEEAAVQGIVQPFADEGPAIAAMVLAWVGSGAARQKPQNAGLAAHARRLEAACVAVVGGELRDGTEPAGERGEGAATLTFREIHVLKLLAMGKSNAGIAQSLFVSENTVRAHLRHIFAKLGTKNRTEAVMRARQRNLIG
ncbi:MAG: LuxR C-terminal-related transcriptional regulator [Burkholderiaceae bacterium]